MAGATNLAPPVWLYGSNNSWGCPRKRLSKKSRAIWQVRIGLAFSITAMSRGMTRPGILSIRECSKTPAFSRLMGIHCLATTVDGQLGPLAFDPNDPSTCPEGAVTLVCHSLKRGLNYFRTGELTSISLMMIRTLRPPRASHYRFIHIVYIPSSSYAPYISYAMLMYAP
ncbi:hypothetical protein MVEN_00432000 [Mycena venus]|uniref:Uncharacterized protein n=1 Tax=Mycena venus TaxID=2733690 RepID=A0A8H6YWG8_9AGAR|nr:hypothetical protein MVEN_00432000 [Mycena venus]